MYCTLFAVTPFLGIDAVPQMECYCYDRWAEWNFELVLHELFSCCGLAFPTWQPDLYSVASLLSMPEESDGSGGGGIILQIKPSSLSRLIWRCISILSSGPRETPCSLEFSGSATSSGTTRDCSVLFLVILSSAVPRGWSSVLWDSSGWSQGLFWAVF
jgi:hypothetical protein